MKTLMIAIIVAAAVLFGNHMVRSMDNKKEKP